MAEAHLLSLHLDFPFGLSRWPPDRQEPLSKQVHVQIHTFLYLLRPKESHLGNERVHAIKRDLANETPD